MSILPPANKPSVKKIKGLIPRVKNYFVSPENVEKDGKSIRKIKGMIPSELYDTEKLTEIDLLNV